MILENQLKMKTYKNIEKSNKNYNRKKYNQTYRAINITIAKNEKRT
jgi:hypothetical protein